MEKMDKLKATVIIWGNDNYNVLGLLRQLTPFVKNVCFLVNNKTLHCATKSKYCKKYKVVRNIDEGIGFLLGDGAKYDEPRFIIASSDLLAEAIDQHKNELIKLYFLCTTKKQGVLTKALDKNYQYELATRIGINVPISQLFKRDTAPVEISFPCLIKPAFKEQGVHHPFKTKICYGEDELRKAQCKLDKNGSYVIQRYINKEKDLLVYGCRFDDETVIYAGSFVKYRWANGDGSYGTIDSKIPSCINTDKLNVFLQEIDYYGLFSVEFGIENDVAWFYEFNLRNDGTSHYFYQANIANLPLAWVQSHFDNAIRPDTYKTNNNKAVFIDEIGDYNNVKLGKVSRSEWEKQKLQASVYKVFDAKDRWPYYYTKLTKTMSHIYHKILRKFK